MKWMIFNVFCRKNEDLTTATTEDDMMKASSLSNHQTTKRSNHQTILTHAEAQRGRGAEMDFCTKEQKVRGGECMEVGMNGQTAKRSNGQTGFSRKGRKERKEGERMEAGMNNPTIQRSNGQTVQRSNGQTGFSRKGRKERKGAGKDGTMNGQTVKRSNGQTVLGQLARWAAVAAVAAGAWLSSARVVEAGASWIGNSAISIDGTWYYDGTSLDWCTGGAFNNANLGTFSDSFDLTCQLQIYDNGSDWSGGGAGDWMHYQIDAGTWHDINISNAGMTGSNMKFQPGGSACTTTEIDISGLSAGPHIISVYFGSVDGQYDSNDGANYKAYFMVSGTATLSATGLDATKYLLNWSDVADRYEVDQATANSFTPATTTYSENFENWATNTEAQCKTLQHGTNDNSFVFNAGNYYTSSNGKEIMLYYNGSYFITPWITGAVTQISYKMRRGGSGGNGKRQVTLQCSTDGENWITLERINTHSYSGQHTYTYTPPVRLPTGERGVKIRWLNTSENASTTQTSELSEYSITYRPAQEGHSQIETATSGTYYNKVAAAGVDSGGTLSIVAGVLPGDLDETHDATSVTVTWPGNASASGYIIDATVRSGTSSRDFECPADALYTNQFKSGN